MKFFQLNFLLIIFCSVCYSQNTVSGLDRDNIKTIKPSEFQPSVNCPTMPLAVVNYLEKFDCLIPQTYFIKNHHNAFQIQFGGTAQNDWVVLCSKKGYSSVFIFWNGSTRNVSQFAEYLNEKFTNSGGYFRVIGKSTSKPLTSSNLKLYGEIIPQINTWGIDELTPKDGRLIYYLYRNQLVVLESDI